MKQTPIIIKVTVVYFVKLPLGEWVNLAQVRSVDIESDSDELVPNINHLVVRRVFDTGKSKAYCGSFSRSIARSLNRNFLH